MKLLAAIVVVAVSSAARAADNEVSLSYADGGLTATSLHSGLLKGDFKVKNPHPFAIKDVLFMCVVRAQSGTELKVYTPTIYKAVPAGGTMTAKDINVGIWPQQADRVTCSAYKAARP